MKYYQKDMEWISRTRNGILLNLTARWYNSHTAVSSHTSSGVAESNSPSLSNTALYTWFFCWPALLSRATSFTSLKLCFHGVSTMVLPLTYSFFWNSPGVSTVLSLLAVRLSTVQSAFHWFDWLNRFLKIVRIRVRVNYLLGGIIKEMRVNRSIHSIQYGPIQYGPSNFYQLYLQ